jgi:hypothetical protein
MENAGAADYPRSAIRPAPPKKGGEELMLTITDQGVVITPQGQYLSLGFVLGGIRMTAEIRRNEAAKLAVRLTAAAAPPKKGGGK